MNASFVEHSKVLKLKKLSEVSSSIGFVEIKEKKFVLDLKLFFIIVNYFLGRFSLITFTFGTNYSIGFRSYHIVYSVFSATVYFDYTISVVCLTKDLA